MPRLRQAPPATDRDRAFDGTGTVLITGGVLGGILARHLVNEHGVRHLLLLSRRGPAAPGVGELIAELTAAGAQVTAEPCDVTDRAALDAVLAGVPAEHPVTAAVHTAGVIDDALFADVTPQRFSGVLAPQVNGTWNLHEATQGLPLRAFVVCTSVAGLFGGLGQAAYGAANGAVDALMSVRQRAGLPGTSLAWGPWEQRSDLTEAPSDVSRMTRTGVLPLTTATGTALFDAAMTRTDAVLAPVALDLAAFRDALVPHLLRALVHTADTTDADTAAVDTQLRERLATANSDEQLDILLEAVRTHSAHVLGHVDATVVGAEDAFLSVGFDSLTTLELRHRLAAVTGLNLSPTVVLSSGTPAKLAELVRTEWALTAAAERPAATQPGIQPTAPAPAASDGDPVGTLFRQLALRGKSDEAIDLLKNASALRTEFRTAAELRDSAQPPELLRVAVHDDAPELVCFGSLVALGGGHQYARFLARFRGTYGASTVFAPGFSPAQSVPASMAAMLEYQTEEIVARLGTDRRLVLLGSSSGGIAAHGVAAELEKRGIQPAGVVLLDTYLATDKAMTQFNSVLLGGMFDREEQAVPMDSARLTTMGKYFRILDDYRPPTVAAPTLLVRASSPLGEAAPSFGGWQSSWPGATTVIDVPGDHFSMLEKHADTTSGAVSAWLDQILS